MNSSARGSISRPRVSFAEANHKAPALPANVSVFAGESARVWHAERYNTRSRCSLEPSSSSSMGALVWQLAPFLALGLVLLLAFGRAGS